MTPYVFAYLPRVKLHERVEKHILIDRTVPCCRLSIHYTCMRWLRQRLYNWIDKQHSLWSWQVNNWEGIVQNILFIAAIWTEFSLLISHTHKKEILGNTASCQSDTAHHDVSWARHRQFLNANILCGKPWKSLVGMVQLCVYCVCCCHGQSLELLISCEGTWGHGARFVPNFSLSCRWTSNPCLSWHQLSVQSRVIIQDFGRQIASQVMGRVAALRQVLIGPVIFSLVTLGGAIRGTSLEDASLPRWSAHSNTLVQSHTPAFRNQY